MYFGKVEIWPGGKKLPKKQYCVFQHSEISFCLYPKCLTSGGCICLCGETQAH